MTPFFEKYEQSPQNYWRSIILLGKNTASYKFAWAKTLNEFVKKNQNRFTMDEAATEQMKFLCESRKRSYFQGVSEMINKSSVFSSIDKFHNGVLRPHCHTLYLCVQGTVDCSLAIGDTCL